MLALFVFELLRHGFGDEEMRDAFGFDLRHGVGEVAHRGECALVADGDLLTQGRCGWRFYANAAPADARESRAPAAAKSSRAGRGMR
ncbi:hypothetical protein [Streptomyces sp. NPDC057557]|uniref:hypothetical protein n=1 Tax=Streptomyces sp. NPDC057557 TaxID=3346167 RepID=UPI0036917929